MTYDPGPTKLLSEHPDLARQLGAEQAKSATRDSVAPTITVPKGLFCARETLPDEPGTLGLLVLDGLLLRGVAVTAQPSIDVLGPGDVFRLEHPGDRCETVPSDVGWWGLRAARLAVLDADFVRRTAAYPQLIAELMGRLWRRSTLTSQRLAIVQQPHLAERLHLVFWHLAGRFGQPEADGMHLPVPLCHTLLSWLVIASRPAVSRAMKELERDGLVEVCADGSWLLRGRAPRDLANAACSWGQPIAA